MRKKQGSKGKCMHVWRKIKKKIIKIDKHCLKEKLQCINDYNDNYFSLFSIVYVLLGLCVLGNNSHLNAIFFIILRLFQHESVHESKRFHHLHCFSEPFFSGRYRKKFSQSLSFGQSPKMNVRRTWFFFKLVIWLIWDQYPIVFM